MSGLNSSTNATTRITRAQASRINHNQTDRFNDTTPTFGPKGIDGLAKLTDLDERLQQATTQYQNELHQQRLTDIKKQLQEAKKDDWRYPPIDSILGYSRN